MTEQRGRSEPPPARRLVYDSDPDVMYMAGDYISVLYGIGHVRILKKADGSLVGTLRQNMNGWKGSDGQVDAAYPMTVTLRKSGG